MFDRQSLWITSTFVVCFVATAGGFKSYENYKVFSIHSRSLPDTNFLRDLESNLDGIDFWDRVHRIENTSYRVMVQPEVEEKFTNLLIQNSIAFQVIIDNVQEVVEREQLAVRRKKTSKFEFDHFWTYDEVNSYLDELAVKFPNYTRVNVIGTTLEGRQMREIVISGDQQFRNANAERPTFLVDATIHAREWISTMTAVHLIHELVVNREKNLDMMKNLNWAVVPIVNPDGYVYAHQHDRFWRKNRNPNINSICVGVDLNRNFDYHWDTPGASSTNPCSESYRGLKPNSEQETVNLSKFIRQYTNAKVYLTLHSYGGYFLYPYGYDVVLVENHEEHSVIGELGAKAIYDYSGYRYKVGNSAKLLYAACGASDDYAAGVANIPLVYTIELPGGGQGGFDIEPSRIPGVTKETFKAIKAIGEYVINKN